MIKLGGLWIRQGTKGEFLAGKLGDASLMIFPNRDKKQGDKLPDYNIFLAEPANRGYQQQGQAQQQRPAAPPRQAPRQPGPPPDDPGEYF